MIGIYKLTNLVTNQSYIGQSKNLEERYKEHLYHRNCTNPSPVDRDIGIYGIENFEYTILEECTEQELDDKEAYYIKLYDTVYHGYNQIAGGQLHNRGEANPKAKLNAVDVYYIRESYKNHINKYIVYNAYKHLVTYYYFSNVWEGISWPDIHMDVYTPENKSYYMAEANKSRVSDEEVLEMRQKYVTKDVQEVYDDYCSKYAYPVVLKILQGKTYRHLPIYDKENKQWLNNN